MPFQCSYLSQINWQENEHCGQELKNEKSPSLPCSVGSLLQCFIKYWNSHFVWLFGIAEELLGAHQGLNKEIIGLCLM